MRGIVELLKVEANELVSATDDPIFALIWSNPVDFTASVVHCVEPVAML